MIHSPTSPMPRPRSAACDKDNKCWRTYGGPCELRSCAWYSGCFAMIGLLKVRWKYGKLCKALSIFFFHSWSTSNRWACKREMLDSAAQEGIRDDIRWKRQGWCVQSILLYIYICNYIYCIYYRQLCNIKDMSAYTFTNINTIRRCMSIIHSMNINILDVTQHHVALIFCWVLVQPFGFVSNDL